MPRVSDAHECYACGKVVFLHIGIFIHINMFKLIDDVFAYEYFNHQGKKYRKGISDQNFLDL